MSKHENLDHLPLPTVDRSDRHPDDVRLRRMGFVIVARPRRGEAVWEYGGLHYTHSEALRLLDGEGGCRGRR